MTLPYFLNKKIKNNVDIHHEDAEDSKKLEDIATKLSKLEDKMTKEIDRCTSAKCKIAS